jgi:short-subunit dehydrogenase
MEKGNFMELENPGTAIVTGASSGLGAIFARKLSEQGFDLIITARRKNRLDDLAKELEEKNSTKVEVLALDLTDMDDIGKLEAKIKKIDNLDCLINNAGISDSQDFMSPTAEMEPFLNMIALHCKAPMIHTHAALIGMMKRNRGLIMNVSTIASLIIHGSHPPLYKATKSFLSVFSEIIQLKLNVMKSKVKIKAICPGYTETEMTAGADKNSSYFSAWMTAEEVVDIALDNALNKDIIVITGEHFVNEVKDWRKVARTKPGRYFSL